MATKVGSLIIDLALESGAFSSGLSKSEKQLKATAKRIEAVGATMADIGAKMSMAVTLPMIAIGKAAIDGFVAQEQAMAQVTAALQSMGGASGKTAGELAKAADALEMNSLIDADVILQQVTAQLLTFGNIAGAQFDRAQQAAIDMATRLGGEPQAAAIQLGKALNDPVKGIAALTKAGVQFSAAQKAQIAEMMRLGDVAGAQGIILGEVEKQFGGAAKAAADSSPWRQAQVAMGQAGDAIGQQLLPMIGPVTEAITSLLQAFNGLSPETQKTVVQFAAVAAAVGPVIGTLGSLVQMTAPVTAIMGALLKGKDVAGALKMIGPALLSVGKAIGGLMMSNPILLGIAAAAAAVYLAWKNWDKIKEIIAKVGAAISGWWNANVAPVLKVVWDKVTGLVTAWWDLQVGTVKALASLYNGVKLWLQAKLDGVLNWLADKLGWAGDLFFQLYDRVVGHSYIPDMVDGIAHHMGRLDREMVLPTQKATKATAEAFKQLDEDVRGLMGDLFPEARDLADFRKGLAAFDSAIARGGAGGYSVAQLRAGRQRLIDRASPEQRRATPLPLADQLRLIESATGPMLDIQGELAKLTWAANDNADAVGVANVRIAKSFKDMADQTLSALERMAGAIKGGGFLDILSAVIGLGLQLGSIGLFGKGVAANINGAKIPGYAGGTSFHPGGLAMVGERGPELVNLPRGSQVIPNHALGRGGAPVINNFQGNLMTPEFWARIQAGDLQAAMAGAKGGEARVFTRQARRVG